jgi:flagellar basal-body rod modification protein FlgD
MPEVTATGTSQAALDQYSKASNADEAKSNELGRNEFMKLLVAQMNNQNPLEPQDNTEFIAQRAQFSQLEGTEQLNSTVTDMAAELKSSQALQASSMVGQSVIVPGNDYGFLQEGDLIAGYAEVPATTGNLSIQIQSDTGETLETIGLGRHDQGPVSFRWDGANLEMDGVLVDIDRALMNRQEVLRDGEGNPVLDANGDTIAASYPAGEYKFVVTASIDGKNEGLETSMSGKVDSVTIGSNSSVTLNLAGGTKAALGDVKQILQ